jgi:hypothetical protein
MLERIPEVAGAAALGAINGRDWRMARHFLLDVQRLCHDLPEADQSRLATGDIAVSDGGVLKTNPLPKPHGAATDGAL